MKQQFVVTHTIRQTEILSLLDSYVVHSPTSALFINLVKTF
jgi:hypothetical protein